MWVNIELMYCSKYHLKMPVAQSCLTISAPSYFYFLSQRKGLIWWYLDWESVWNRPYNSNHVWRLARVPWLLELACNNNYSGRNWGEQMKTWVLATNLVGVDYSMLLCFREHSSVTWASRVFEVTSIHFTESIKLYM